MDGRTEGWMDGGWIEAEDQLGASSLFLYVPNLSRVSRCCCCFVLRPSSPVPRPSSSRFQPKPRRPASYLFINCCPSIRALIFRGCGQAAANGTEPRFYPFCCSRP